MNSDQTPGFGALEPNQLPYGHQSSPAGGLGRQGQPFVSGHLPPLDDSPLLGLSPGTLSEALPVLFDALKVGADFKASDTIYQRRAAPEEIRSALVTDLPQHPRTVRAVMDEFTSVVLPLCKNESSPFFLGFADTGGDVAALCGSLLASFTQQNLINQSFDSPSATFVEIAVLRWLRQLLGYPVGVPDAIDSVWQAGGAITHGGTMSNTMAMMLAREHAVPDTMTRGVRTPERFAVIVPAGIGHYSIKSALTWIGCGAQVVEVDTLGYRYDLQALARALRVHRGRVMAVVAYAGDSRTQTVENLRGVLDVTRSADPDIWLHADACWGFICALTDRLHAKIDGIWEYDSITVDPHKVLAVPYSLSALLVRQPASMRTISSYSDLIMQEQFAFGQVTPFIGSKGWISLKLWMMFKAHGRTGLARMIDRRLDITQAFVDLIDRTPQLIRLHDPDLVAVAFMFRPSDFDPNQPDIVRLNEVNQRIHQGLLDEGRWYLHQFSLPDAGLIQRGAVLYPLRFLGANSRVTSIHLTGIVDRVVELGQAIERDLQ